MTTHTPTPMLCLDDGNLRALLQHIYFTDCKQEIEMDGNDLTNENPMKEMLGDLEPIKDAPLAPAHGIAAMALSMSLKFHDINTVQDGVLYQQYKMEGKNMHGLHLDHVLETAGRLEAWLLGSSDRIAKIVVDAIAHIPEDEGEGEDQPRVDDPDEPSVA